MPGLSSYAQVWLLFVFAWVANYLVRIAFAALLPPMMADIGLSYTRAGLLASGFFVAYAVMQFPAGLLGGRFGWRRILLLGLVAGALASAATGLAVSFATLLGARLLTGASQGCLFSNDRAIIASVTPSEKIAFGQALSFAGPGLGITAGFLFGGLLGELVTWRTAFFIFALPPLLAAVLIARFVPLSPKRPHHDSLRASLARVVSEPDIWLLGIAAAATMWVQYVFATWAPLLFMEAGVTELGRAGLYASAQGLAGVAGLVAGGWLADRAQRRGLGRKIVVAGSLTALAAAMLALTVAVERGASVPVLAATLFAVSFCAWGMWGPSFAVMGEVFTGLELSTAFGLYNSLCVVGAIIGPALTGWTRDLTGAFVTGCYLCIVVALAGAVSALLVRSAGRLRRGAFDPRRL